MVATAIGSPRKQGTPSIWRASVVMRLDSMSAQCSRWTEEGRRSTTNLAPRKCLVGVCESVRIKSSLAFAPARSWPTSVRRIRVSSRQHSKSTSLRGWRSQDRGGSSPPFRTTPTAWCSMGSSGAQPSRFALGFRARVPPSAPPF